MALYDLYKSVQECTHLRLLPLLQDSIEPTIEWNEEECDAESEEGTALEDSPWIPSEHESDGEEEERGEEAIE